MVPASRLLPFLGALVALSAAGCQTVSESRGNIRPALEKTRLSTLQIRLLLNDFTLRFVLRVEAAADGILAGTRSPEVTRNALLWKINGCSACFLASSRRDPFGGLGDVTILTMQMRRFFEDGAGRELFGPAQPAAVALSRDLEQEALELGALLSGDKAGLEPAFQRLREFADHAPLSDLTFVRSSVARQYLDRFLVSDRGVVEMVGSMNDVVLGLQELVALQMAHLPKQARWEAELLLLDLDRSPPVASALGAVAALKSAMDRVAPVLEGLPEFLRDERRTILRALFEERQETMRDLGKFRDEALTRVDGMRTATIGELRQERGIVLDQVADQRRKFVGELDGLTTRRVEEALAGAESLFGRALLAGFLGGAALIAVVLTSTFVLRRRA